MLVVLRVTLRLLLIPKLPHLALLNLLLLLYLPRLLLDLVPLLLRLQFRLGMRTLLRSSVPRQPLQLLILAHGLGAVKVKAVRCNYHIETLHVLTVAVPVVVRGGHGQYLFTSTSQSCAVLCAVEHAGLLEGHDRVALPVVHDEVDAGVERGQHGKNNLQVDIAPAPVLPEVGHELVPFVVG